MYSVRQFAFLIVVSLSTILRAAGSPPRLAEGHIVIVESAGAVGRLDRRRVATIVKQACAELMVDDCALPEIVFIHLSSDEARAGGVPAGTTVMMERSMLTVEQKHSTESERFLVWLVGEPTDGKVVGAVAHVLRLHLRPEISDIDLLNAEKRIAHRMGATVSVNSFIK